MNEEDYIKMRKMAKKCMRLFDKIDPSLSDSFEEEFTRGKYRYNVRVKRIDAEQPETELLNKSDDSFNKENVIKHAQKSQNGSVTEKPRKKGCGKRFRTERDLSLKDRTFKSSTYKTVITCGDNLTNTLCPECKAVEDANDGKEEKK